MKRWEALTVVAMFVAGLLIGTLIAMRGGF